MTSTQPTAFRWIILAMVVSATTINYLDRQIIALLKPVLEDEFNWSDRDYGHVVAAFQFSAALAYLGVGWFVDRVGVRRGYAISVAVWSAAAMAHAAAKTVLHFMAARMLLGVAEAANTPAAVKTIAQWFPARERAFALGWMNSGSNMGAIVTPLIVPVLAIAFGWQMAFILTGATGFIWLAVWLAIRRQPTPDASAPAESAPANSLPAGVPPTPAPTSAPIRWRTLLRDRRTWAIAGAKLLTDPVWWFLLFWLPDFMNRVYGLDLRTFGLPLAAIYSLATVGALTGGWIPGRMQQRGASLNTARKMTLLVCALAVVPLPFVLTFSNVWYAVLLVGLALAAHQGFSTNVFALATDLFPARVVGSVVGIGALFGNLGGLAMLEFTGWVLDTTGSYWPMFLMCSVAYLLGLLVIQLLVPKVRAAEPEPPGTVAAMHA